MRLLAGDIGGTNARLVLYDAPDDREALSDAKNILTHKVVSQKYYKNNDFQSFTEVLCSFISLPGIQGTKIHTCCLAIAGPVADNRINFTNREGWIVDGNSIRDEFAIDRVVLINDFVANGYGLLSLTHQELSVLQEGKAPPSPSSSAPVALVGAGTGLGECFLTPGPNGALEAFPTEGGHVEFAPRTKLEEELLSFLQSRLNHHAETPTGEADLLPRVSVERLVSGKGLENIYEFLREKYPDQVDHSRDADYNSSNERGRLIGAEKYNYSLFGRALEIMFNVFGGEVGNVALKYLPYGGIYVAGGIAPKNIEFINGPDSEFMRRFLDKGRMTSIMSDFPVYVVMQEDLGLRGAHNVASQRAAELVSTSTKDIPIDETSKLEPTLVSRETSLSVLDGLREAVSTYPLTYAVVCTLTSALAAGAVVGSMQFMKTIKRS